MATIEEKNFGTLAALREATEQLLRDAMAGTPDDRAPYAVMLSGGSTPLPIYEAIAGRPSAVSEWLYITFSDDRHVPLDSPMSNHGNTLPMIAALGIGTDHVLAVNPEVALEESAAEFEQDFDDFFAGGGTLRLALLGMGEDTHTCSLFTEADLHAAENHLAIPVKKPEPPDRVSVTPSVLELAERVVFLVAGANKGPVIEKLLNDPENTIAGRAVVNCPRVELWYAL